MDRTRMIWYIKKRNAVLNLVRHPNFSETEAEV